VGLSFRRAHLAAANKLDLATDEPKTGNDFGIELPDELESQLSELTLTEESLAGGNRLQDMHFPKGTLVMMVKRGNSFIVPNGQLELRPGDILLTIAQQSITPDGWYLSCSSYSFEQPRWP